MPYRVAFLLTLLGCCLAPQAVAQIADLAAGARRAQVCFACHGENGVALVVGTPHLAGQDRRYLENALRAYRSGQRAEPAMAAMAKPLSDSDIVNIAAYFHAADGRPKSAALAAELASLERIRPVGVVQVGTVAAAAPEAVVPPAPAAPREAAAIYTQFCTACHANAVAGAPKRGDSAAWKPRLAQGRERLLQHTLQGFNAMPPRGTCADCSDEELAAAMDYLSGG
ncbi:MAG: cytochrome c4 [Xanthomonadales bacterium]|jgi:cytochrome c5|nr:cytochrome c4 [Xanthomonadales bacterium]